MNNNRCPLCQTTQKDFIYEYISYTCSNCAIIFRLYDNTYEYWFYQYLNEDKIEYCAYFLSNKDAYKRNGVMFRLLNKSKVLLELDYHPTNITPQNFQNKIPTLLNFS